ncbi:Vitamin B12 import system permease protein BtuC [Streptomyces microflavus]
MATTTVAPPSGAGTSRTGAARTAFLLLAAVAALTVALCASVMFGSRSTSLGDVLDVLGSRADANVTAIIESRYPRTVLGVLAGLCLAVAGTLMQGVSRNPLAEPGLLGINAGASASIVAATAWFGASGATDTMWWALPGALVAGVLVHVIGSARRRRVPAAERSDHPVAVAVEHLRLTEGHRLDERHQDGGEHRSGEHQAHHARARTGGADDMDEHSGDSARGSAHHMVSVAPDAPNQAVAATMLAEAPALMPRSPGSASGLRETPCMRVPATARQSPARTPRTVLG